MTSQGAVSWEKSAHCDITITTFNSNVFEKWRKEKKQRLFLGCRGVPDCFTGVCRQARDTFYYFIVKRHSKCFFHIMGAFQLTKKTVKWFKLDAQKVLLCVAIVVKLYLKTNLDDNRGIINYSVIRKNKRRNKQNCIFASLVLIMSSGIN